MKSSFKEKPKYWRLHNLVITFLALVGFIYGGFANNSFGNFCTTSEFDPISTTDPSTASIIEIAEPPPTPDSLTEIPKWYHNKGLTLVSQHKYLHAKYYFQKASDLYLENRDKIGYTKVLHQLALLHTELGDYTSAIGFLHQTYDKYIEMSDEEGMANLEIDQSLLLLKWKKYNAAEKHLKQALEYFKKTKNTQKIKTIELQQGLLMLNKQNYKEAEEIFMNLVNNNDTTTTEEIKWESYLNLGNIYLALNQNELALEYFTRAAQIAEKNNDKPQLSMALLAIGQGLIQNKNWQNAEFLLQKSYDLAVESGIKETQMIALRSLSQVNKNKGDLHKAIDNLNKYISLKDKLFSDEGNLLINQLIVSYETDHIKKAYNNELKRNTRVSKELHSKKQTKNIILLIGIFVVIVSLIIVIFNSLRTRENRKGYAMLAFKNKKISEQKEILSELNLKLTESREQYRSIVENASIGMYQTTKEGKVKYANNALKKMLRLPPSATLDIFDLNKDIPHRSLFIETLEAKQVITGREDIWKRFDGTDMEVNESAWIVRNNAQEILYFEGVVEDISNRKTAERELIKSQKKLQEINQELTEKNRIIEISKNEAINANEIKSLFLANVSHEIRTPMNSIIGFSEVLESHTTDQKLLHYITAIKTSGISLLGLLNDILDLSKIQAREIELNYEPVSLISTIKDLENSFHLRVIQKELSLKVMLPDTLPKALLLDKNKFRQILTNLIDNAIKFTDKGNISVTFDMHNQKSQSIDLHINVTDTGIGIMDEELKTVFEAFKQSKFLGKRAFGGTGLGLNIAKQLTESMGGEIKLKSKPENGTTFTVILPNIQIAAPSSPEKEVMQEQNTSGKTSKTTNQPLKLKNDLIYRCSLTESTTAELVELFGDEWKKMIDSCLINVTTSFVKKITHYSKENKLSCLATFCEEMETACACFDIDNIEFYINELKTIFSK